MYKYIYIFKKKKTNKSPVLVDNMEASPRKTLGFNYIVETRHPI